MSNVVAGGHVHTVRTLYPKWRSFQFLQRVGKAGSGVSSVERGQERRWMVQPFALEQAMKAQCGNRGISLLFLQPQHYMRWSKRRDPATLPRRSSPVTHCTEGCVGPRDGLGGCGESRPLPGLDPQTVQTVATRYPGLPYNEYEPKRP